MKKHITVRGWDGHQTSKRMVNQDEIVNYFTHNPGRTESQMQEDVYGYYRNGSFQSNKKYADCLRRALSAGRLGRVKARTPVGNRFIYFAI